MTRRPVSAYDVADHYDEAYFADLASRYRTRNRFARQRIANVFSLLPELRGRTLVDLGCGMGTFTIEAAARGAFAIGVDPAPAAVQAAHRVAAAEAAAAQGALAGVGPGADAAQGTAEAVVNGAAREGAAVRTGAGSACFVRGDAAVLPLQDGIADIILAADLTEHLDDVTLARILKEAWRALRPDGLLVLYTPDRQHFFERLRDRGIMKQDPSHIGVRSAAELAESAVRAGFEVTRLEWLPSHLPGLQLAERALARRVPLLRRRIGLVASRCER